MQKTLWIIPLLLSIPGSCAQPDRVRTRPELHAAALYTFNERELNLYLKSLANEPLTTAQRVARLARKNIGQPYRIYLLGEFPHELHDPDPMYCLSASDCVTFVEHTYAMALADDWSSFFNALKRIRYKDGKVGMLTRNHFTEADWNPNNAWLFEDVTERIAGGDAQPMHTTVDRAAFFAKYGIGRDFPVQQVTDAYIPSETVPAILSRLETADVIEFVRGNDAAQYVGHMGLIVRDAHGRVMLLHSAKPAVRGEPLMDYVRRHDNILGIKVLRFIPSADSKHHALQSPRPQSPDNPKAPAQ